MVMEPFDDEMFPDLVTFSRGVRVTSPQGASRVTFPEAGDEMAASVQQNRVVPGKATGRAFTDASHVVRTMTNVNAVAGDKFEYTPVGDTAPHKLTVQGHTEPGGIGDVIWITPCLEVR